MANRLSRLRGDERGASAIIFSLMAVALLVVVGMALDLQRVVSTQTRLQAALDAAALAGARTLEDASASDQVIIKIATDTFDANMMTGHGDVGCLVSDVQIDRASGLVHVDGDCNLPTTFASLVKMDEVEMNDRATARAAITKLDVALMLDVSGSMKGKKLKDLKIAASDAIDTLITDRSGDRVRIAFNTYATSVNAGAYAGEVMDLPKGSKKTCVSERTGDEAYTDAAPGKGAWLGKAASACPKSSVEPLTADAGKLKAEIDKLKTEVSTAGHLGVAWAWYLISPEWSGIWPAASRPHDYAEPNTLKVVILMTDGEFNKEYGGPDSEDQAVALCANMRSEGILVYSILFDTKLESARTTMSNCAGDASRYFEAGNGKELGAAYQAIASQLTNLSLTE